MSEPGAHETDSLTDAAAPEPDEKTTTTPPPAAATTIPSTNDIVDDFVVVQTQTQPPAAAEPLTAAEEASLIAKSRSKRANIAHEIAASEASYVRSLELLVSRYVQAIVSAEPEVLNAATRRELTSSLSEILAVHQLFLKELDATVSVWNDEQSRMGPHFIKFTPYFKLYNDYCANYNSFISKINVKLQRPDHPLAIVVTQVAADLRAEVNLRLDLASLLIMPVQRLPRYRLLLTELVDATSKDNGDHALLSEALVQIANVAQQVNASVAARANRDKLMSIAHELRVTRGNPPAIVVQHRTFVREGELRKLCRKGVKRRRVWLFSDSLLYATPSDVPGTRISIKPALLMLRGASVAEVPAKSLAIEDATPFALQISTPTKSFIAYAETMEERNAWLEALIGVILKLGGGADVGEDAPVWVPDEIAHNCMVCDTPFSFKRRRHHCFRASDHQILTNRGFLQLEDVERIAADKGAWDDLRVASYDVAYQQLVYKAPVALIVNQGEQELVEFRSNTANVYLAATSDHDMWADDGRGRFAKIAAAKLQSNARFMAAAVKGVAGGQQCAFPDALLQLYGFSIALGGAVTLRGSMWQFNVQSQAQRDFVVARARTLAASFDVQERCVTVYCNRFDCGAISMPQLSTAAARAVVIGLRAASGSSSFKVSDAIVRDAIVQLLYHTGYSASFAADGSRWRVSYGDDSAAQLSESRIVRQSCRTWCFDMDDGFVVVRSVVRSGCSVQSVSRATIQGNCRRCGKVCCASCSTMRTNLANIGDEARVCDHCFTAVTGETPPEVPKQPESTWDKFGLSARSTVVLRKWSSKLFEAPTPPPVPPKKAKPLPAIPDAAVPAASAEAVESDSDELPPPVTPGVSHLLAIFSYEAVEENELSFETGALIEVIEWDADSAWWVGKLADGSTGLVPVNHCIDGASKKTDEPPPIDAESSTAAATAEPTTEESLSFTSEPSVADEPTVAADKAVAEPTAAVPAVAEPIAPPPSETPPLPPKKARSEIKKV